VTKGFLDSLISVKTKKSYKHGLKVFEEFYRKPAQMLGNGHSMEETVSDVEIMPKNANMRSRSA